MPVYALLQVFFLIDDFGWADASWHRPKGYKEVQTPHMQQLVDTGIELTRNVSAVARPTPTSALISLTPVSSALSVCVQVLQPHSQCDTKWSKSNSRQRPECRDE